MGFYIQDDYYTEAVGSFKTRADQDAFWGLLIRYYFTGTDRSSDVRSTAVRAAFALTKARIDKARKNAVRMREKREQDANSARTVHAQNASYLKESEREKEKEREIVDVDVLETSRLEGADEIGYDPRGFAHFMAESIRLYNEATGQLYMSATAAARQGMLDAFKAGRTIDDVKRVMDDVATWPSNMQTLNGVFADGKFEQHVNFVGGGGADVPDWSEFNDLVTRVS